jgi:AraC-like DNA-binding protein/mannose-6-phosphate isomerase-like protein (cupin superfamily)
MRPTRRRIHYEQIRRGAESSFAVRRFKLQSFPFLWHYHPELELTLVIRGRGLRFIGDAIEQFKEGDLCLLPSNLPHTWSSAPGIGRVESIVCHFLPDFWGKGFSELPEMHAIRELIAHARLGLNFSGRGRARAAQLMAEMVRNESTGLERLLRLIEALAELSRSRDARPLCRTPVNAAADLTVGRRLKHVLDRLHAELVDLPSQAELAGEVGLSPQAFSRFFKRRVGKTFVQYVNEWRVGLACRALIESEESITGIALDSGFENLSNFNRQFKRVAGVTPSAYRAQARPSGV